MPQVRLATRRATALWDGDVAVIGAGLAGLKAARAVAEQGRSVCLLEPAPTLGIEVSQCWLDRLPPDELTDELLELCAEQNARRKDRVDVFACTLAFDQLAARLGIRCIVRVVPMRPVADDAGELRGVEVVGKSGRQLVRASSIIDATPYRRFSRRVLGQPPPQLLSATRRLYLHGVELPPTGMQVALPAGLGIAGDSVSLTPAVWGSEALACFTIELVGDPSLALVLHRTQECGTQLVAYLRRTVEACADATLVGLAPVPAMTAERDEIDAAPLAGTGLHMLPLANELGDELRLVDGVVRGALRRTAVRPLPGAAQRSRHPEVPELVSSELTAASEQDLAAVALPDVLAQLHEPVDVVVAGYGTGGAFAALAAAEQGVSVAALDPAPLPGGIGTAGKIHSYYHGVPGGLQDRLDELCAGAGAALAAGVRGYHPVGKASVLNRSLHDAGVSMFAGHVVFGVVMDGATVQGVLSAAEDGYHVFPCTVAIDGTGDGDLAASAGAEFSLGRQGDGFPQPYSYTPSRIVDGKLTHHNFDAGWVDPTDTLDYSRAHFEGRQRLWDSGPFSDAAHYCDLASILGIRESRFILGPVTLTFEDFLQGRSYPDTVCDATAHHDNHAVDYAEESDWAWRHVVMFGMWRQMCRGEVPFRALRPQAVANVLIACRALSVDHDLHQLLRMQRDLQKIGEICGVAAALAVRSGVSPAQLDLEMLRQDLLPRGVTYQAAEAVLDLPAAELLDRLGTEQNGLAMWRLSLLPAEAGPDWNAFFASERDEQKRFAAAVTLAVSGRAGAEAKAILANAIEARLDEPRLGVKSPPRFVVAALALAAARVPGLAATIGQLLLEEQLDAPSIVLLLKALGGLGDAEAVTWLKRFLVQTSGDTFANPLWGVGAGKATSFRFAVDLCAVRSLMALGCDDERDRLHAYTQHENLLLRRYARRLEGEARKRMGICG